MVFLYIIAPKEQRISGDCPGIGVKVNVGKMSEMCLNY